MSNSFSTEARIFPCSNCGEIIYSDSLNCRFCKAPVDRAAAEAAADNQKQVNNAVNLSKWIRNAAGAMWVFVGLGLFLGLSFLFATAAIFLIPAGLVYWQYRYGGMETADADYEKTKRERMIALLLWAPASIIQGLLLIARFIL